MANFLMYDEANFRVILKDAGVSDSIIDQIVAKGNPTEASSVSLIELDTNLVLTGGDTIIVTRDSGTGAHSLAFTSGTFNKPNAVKAKIPPRNSDFRLILEEMNSKNN